MSFLGHRLRRVSAPDITYVGGVTYSGQLSSAQTLSLTSLTGGLASAPSNGDLIIVGFVQGSPNSNNTLTIKNNSSGGTAYTLVGSELYQAGGVEGVNLRVGSFVAASSTAVYISSSALNSGYSVAVQVWRNATVSGVTPTTATGASSVLANPPSITPIASGSVVVACGGGAHTIDSATYISSDLGNFLTSASAVLHDSIVGMGSKDDWVSGAFNPAAFTFSDSDSANFAWAALTLVLNKR